MPIVNYLPRSRVARVRFLAQHAAQRILKKRMTTLYVLAQHLIDQRLIVVTTRSIYLALEPLDDVLIETNRDSGLALRYADHRGDYPDVLATIREYSDDDVPGRSGAAHASTTRCSITHQTLCPWLSRAMDGPLVMSVS